MPNKQAKINAEYKNFIVKIFRTVPPKTALVTVNTLTGNTAEKASGFRIVPPWKKGKLVLLSSFNVDYPAANYRTADGLEVNVDVSLSVRVEDPIKFEFDINDPKKELEVTTQAIIRDYIATKTYEELRTEHFSLSSPSNSWIVDRYNKFKELSGTKIDSMRFQNLDLANPETKRQFEAARAQERENAEMIAKATAEAKAAQIRAEGKQQVMKANMETIEQFAEALRKKRCTPTREQLVDLFQTVTVVNSENPNVNTHALVGSKGSSLENSAMILTDGKVSSENVKKTR